MRVGATCALRSGQAEDPGQRCASVMCAHTRTGAHTHTRAARVGAHAATRAGEAKSGSKQAKPQRIRADSSMPVDTSKPAGGDCVPSEAISSVIEPIATRLL